MIGPVVEATLPLMQSHAESLMDDACRVDRETTAWDETLQKSVTTWAEVLTTVCDVDFSASADRDIITGETMTRHAPAVFVPASVAGILPDDRVTITSIGSTSSVDLLGAVLWVSKVEAGSHVVERQVDCRWLR